MINIKIQKKDLWLLAAIMVFLIGVAYVIAFNPSGTGGNPAIMGHSADEIESVGFGARGAKSLNTPYQASTDGFVIVTNIGCNSGETVWIRGYADFNDPPNTIRAEARIVRTERTGNDDRAIFTMPVRKDERWLISSAGSVGTFWNASIYWIPLGN